MARLRIFGPDSENAPKKNRFADDIVGRFRSGYQVNNRPAALQAWRVTTGDPEVANAIHAMLGGEAPQEWESKGEDTLEVFTDAKRVEIILDGPESLRQQMVLRNRNGEIVQAGDGETLTYPESMKGEPDPDADLSFQERKQKARDGIGAEPEISVIFRLAENPDLGLFRFTSGSWSLASDLNYHDVPGELADLSADSESGKVLASLGLEVVEFTAKSGPRAGQLVSYTKPVIKIKGEA